MLGGRSHGGETQALWSEDAVEFRRVAAFFGLFFEPVPFVPEKIFRRLFRFKGFPVVKPGQFRQQSSRGATALADDAAQLLVG